MDMQTCQVLLEVLTLIPACIYIIATLQIARIKSSVLVHIICDVLLLPFCQNSHFHAFYVPCYE